MDRKQQLYLWLTGLFVTALIVSDLIGGRFFRIGDIDLSVGMLAFPLTFVLTDVVNEFYGAEGAKRLTFVGLGAAGFAFLVINVALALPPSSKGLPDAIFRNVFGWSQRLYVASLVAYVVGQLSDIAMFGVFRRLTKHRLLWLRATGSTLISQAIDTIVVNFVLLTGRETSASISRIVYHSYVTKLIVAVSLTPVIYAAHALIGRVLKIRETARTEG